VQLAHVRLDRVVDDHVHDAPVLNHIVPVRHRACEAKILLHEQDRQPPLLQRPDRAADLLDDDGGEPCRRLVEQQQFRLERQRGGDLERTLSAVGQKPRRHRLVSLEVYLGEQRPCPRVMGREQPLRPPEVVGPAARPLQRHARSRAR